MHSAFSNLLRIPIIMLIIICIFFIPVLYASTDYSTTSTENPIYSSYDFLWPIPDYYTISSYFGKRSSPTAGASTSHSGIDIPAPEGTRIVRNC